MHWPSVITYTISSILIVSTNKAVLSNSALSGETQVCTPTGLMLYHNAALLVVLIGLHGLGMIQLLDRGRRTNNSFWVGSITLISDLWIGAVSNAANIALGLSGTAVMSVAMFMALRRLSNVMTMWGERYFLQKRHTILASLSVYGMLISTALAMFTDANFSPQGYVYALLNNLLTVVTQIGMSKSLSKKHNKWTITFCNTCVALCLCMTLSVLGGQTCQVFDYWLFGSIASSIVLNISTVWALERNGSLTLSMVGSSKNIVVGLLSSFGWIGNDYIFTWSNFLALQVGAIAAITYMVVEVQNTESCSAKQNIDTLQSVSQTKSA